MGTVVGLFESKDKAQRAVEALRRAGFRDEDISLVMRDRRESTTAATEASHLETEAGTGGGVAAGAVGGGLLGSLAGLAVGVGALAIPGIGPIVAAGPLAAILAGGAIGAATGGILGTLVEAGVPEEEARDYQAGVERGAVLLTVHAPDSREDEARSILRQSGMRDLHEHRNQWAGNPDDTSDPSTQRSNNMAARKTDKDHGDQAKVDTTVAGTAGGGTAGAVVGGAVGDPIGAGVGAVAGSALGGGAGAAYDNYDAAEPEFRHEWERGPSKESTAWDQASAAYRYGWESHDKPEYKGRSWDEVHTHLKQNWPGKGDWSQYETFVRSAWDRRARQQLEQGGQAVVPVVEEELEIGKRKIETGGARVQTHVTETPVREHVILHEEHINVERRPADRDASREDLAAALKKGSIEVRETAEEAVVAKKPKVVEEVVINKEGRDRTETVEDTVRRTDVDVKQADTPTKVTDEGVTKEVKAHPKKS